ncbi:acetyl-CoA carboxylase biotin carboxyl carrier protein subunit [Clostridium kluyveri]|uniref:Acetyl-CoA carboxylase biotin carboxyl carrier protein subunit n=1 Tax=Clostridium kluyveri TaxID=1534 RepID=A0A1L5F4G6_CLOKL|nr:acetyl-CoA carboxylase biotin carboxyl carrier protein subunit [Clostridium kluyveri]APM37867.1 acetyl-CoA carboxylase biotin carboxyl carrier protein subunit [Clostridium kluyveri]
MEKKVCAHMPGLVARVVVNEGDKVTKNQEVAVLNCMKVEIPVLASDDGVVKGILAKEWDEMEIGTPMVILEV